MPPQSMSPSSESFILLEHETQSPSSHLSLKQSVSRKQLPVPGFPVALQGLHCPPPPQSIDVSFPFLMPSVHDTHMLEKQRPDRQSLSIMQAEFSLLPFLQAALTHMSVHLPQFVPPQFMSVSSPSIMLFVQDTHLEAEQRPLAQSSPIKHPFPSAQYTPRRRHPGPPQSLRK